MGNEYARGVNNAGWRWGSLIQIAGREQDVREVSWGQRRQAMCTTSEYGKSA